MFYSGLVYRHFGTGSHYSQILNASSKGGYLNANVNGVYEYSQK